MSGTSKTRSMAGIVKFRIGGNAAANFNGVYDGKIDEFRVWNKALDNITIKSWMNKTIDSSHPFIPIFRQRIILMKNLALQLMTTVET